MKKIENPIPTFLSVAVSTYTGYAVYNMVTHGYTSTAGIVGSLAFSYAVAHTITIDGMSKHGEHNNVSGINKLGAIIAIQYALLVPTIYDSILGFVDERYPIVKKEYASIPKYDESKLNRVLTLDADIVKKHDNYIKDSKEKYYEVKNNPTKYIDYSKYKALKADRDKLKTYKSKVNSEYSKAVKTSQIALCDLSNGSDSVAECFYSIKMNNLKDEYLSKKEYADNEYPIYISKDNKKHSLEYKQDIANNSANGFENQLLKKEAELKKIEDKFPLPYWVLFPIVWLAGFFFETRIANMDVFTRYELSKKKMKKELYNHDEIKEVKDNTTQLRILAEHNNMIRVLSSSDEFIKWCSRINDNFSMNRDIATLYSVLKATLNINPDDLVEQKGINLTADKIQGFSIFINPRSKDKKSVYNIIPSQMMIRKLLKSKKALIKSSENSSWIIDETALKIVLKKL